MHPQLVIGGSFDTERTGERIADETVSLRLGRVSDDPILEQLAALEGRELYDGRHLVAEVNGEVVAALPLAGGEPLADPFRRTSQLLPLMRQYAATIVPSRSRVSAGAARAGLRGAPVAAGVAPARAAAIHR